MDRSNAKVDKKHSPDTAEGHLVARIFTWISTDHPTWLPAELQRKLWPTDVRFDWLKGRPEARARVVHETTGLSEGAAGRLQVPLQSSLVDAVVDNGDTSAALWADAWEPSDLGANAPAGSVQPILREAFPWNAPPTKDSRAFLARWLHTLLSADNGPAIKPILTPLAFRSAIDATVWQEFLPLTIRATVDAARIRSEWKKRPFTAGHELTLVTIDTIVEHLPAKSLQPVLEAAEKALAAQSTAEQSPSNGVVARSKSSLNDIDHADEITRA